MLKFPLIGSFFHRIGTVYMIGAVFLGLHQAQGMEVYTLNTQNNMWVTWANQTGQTSFCLSLASATDPFRTCLFGLPFQSPEELCRALAGWFTGTCTDHNTTAQASADVINSLNASLPWDPQELDLMGSVAVQNESNNGTQTCFMIGQGINLIGWTNVTAHTHGFGYQDKGDYCGTNKQNQGLGALGAEGKSIDTSIWVNDTAKGFPPGIFLICGDRAWPGIPVRAYGGPCYLGKLTLLSPPLAQLYNYTRTKRSKRSLTHLSSDCNDSVKVWGPAARISASIIPSIGTAHALTSLTKLACWSVKQSNTTTRVISELAQDVGDLRHAVLQNRAAIDFLLLAQGHGCEEFDGMCCFNLSDHSNSIHKQLAWLQEHTQKITVASSPFDSWLQSVFGSLSGWALSLIKEGLRWLLIIIIILFVVRIIFTCLEKRLAALTAKAFVAQNTNGGIVGEWLVQQGHVSMKELTDAELSKYRTQLV